MSTAEDQSVLERNLIRDLDRFTDVRMRMSWFKVNRNGIEMSPERFQYLKEEWVAGRFHNPDTIIHRNHQWASKARSTTNCSWTGDQGQVEFDQAAAARVAEEIQIWARVRLLTGEDGCPYFGHEDTTPSPWSRSVCHWAMLVRFFRLWSYCNRCWVTIDTVTGIYLECIFQACIWKMPVGDGDFVKLRLKATYEDLLGLPLTAKRHDPLNYNLGHRCHGEQMRTGWPAWPQPIESLSQRLERDEENNILLETQASNYLKHNFHEKWYPDFVQMVKDIRVPLELANPLLPLSPRNVEFEFDTRELTVEEEDEAGELEDWEGDSQDGSQDGSEDGTEDGTEDGSEDGLEEDDP